MMEYTMIETRACRELQRLVNELLERVFRYHKRMDRSTVGR